ncbi:MAG TPA: ABC-2 family transporter protein [Myxococcota bacterium]|nr:ABC-2 family transporter protein [Myxococcota bacterium]
MTAQRLGRVTAKYLAFARAAGRRARAQRWSLLGRTVFIGIVLFVFSRIWAAIGPRDGLPGIGPRDLIWYLALTEWPVLSVPQAFLAIEADVRSGDVAVRLVRPVAYVGAHLAEAAGETATRLVFVGSSAFTFAYFIAGGLPADPRGLLLALPLVLLACVLLLLSVTAIGVTSFWVVDSMPFFWIWQKLMFVLGGLLFPLELYPEWLQRVARATPFPYMCWGPGSMAFGFAPGRALVNAAGGLAWAAALAAGLVALSRGARARLSVNGG